MVFLVNCHLHTVYTLTI